MRRIGTPSAFLHAGLLNRRYGDWDPRSEAFGDDPLEIDLRGCEFIRPPAILWCATYALSVVARGVKCRVLVPANFGVCIHLKSIALFEVLRHAGVEVDDRGIGSSENPQIILPVTQFRRESEVEDLANRALTALSQRGFGAANIHPLVTEVFAELATNAVQHSDSPIGGLGLIQFYQFQHGERFIITVADGGIGIRSSLERNAQLRDEIAYDWDAIELALREGVSGTGLSTRGIGLFGVGEDMQEPGRQLIIHSGQGMLNLSAGVESQAQRTIAFPGTLVSASIPT